MRTIHKFVSAVCMVCALTACEDKLDIEQHGVMNRETYYQSDDQALGALAAVYNDVLNLEGYHQAVLNLLSDDEWAGWDIHGGEYWDVGDYAFDGGSIEIAPLFSAYYNVIGKCNVILDNVSDDTPFKRQTLAEARVIRAWIYFYLTTLWGNPPLVTSVPNPSEASLPNTEPDQLYAFMEQELTEAIASGALQEKVSADDRTLYHASKQFAQAVLGKVYLWQGKNKEAAEQFELVINSGKYKLWDGDYDKIFSVTNKNNCESVFESNYVINEINPSFRLAQIVRGLRNVQWNFGDNLLGIGNVSGIGFGGLVPRKSLYDAFVAEEGPIGKRLAGSIITYETMQLFGYSLISGQRCMSEGYWWWKGHFEQEGTVEAGPFDYNNNVIWMRYSEVLLLAAEAHLAAGNQAKADSYFNMVRTRVGLPNKTATLDAIKLEKRLELCNECVRFQDLLRWGDAYEVLKNQGKVAPEMSSNGVVEYKSYRTEYGFKQGKHERLPYPTTEVTVNKNIKQNPNY
ncbi:MAG: RagB/SusD family nutrient uptake outer membrane protein [Bacteroidaceae bacterium]|nr:RagB/SusD family nutrient uptake outer membrane protein [Bacteroidaceae bacterium]